MKIVCMGTGTFGIPTLEALYQHPSHEVAALVTQPVPQTHTQKKPLPTPEIVRIAEQHQTPVYHIAKIKSPEAVETLRSFQADLFFICDYGQILSQEGIQAARLGGLNLHGSLLPKYRGAAPVHWAIYNGDEETGVTVIHITPEMDAGPMVASEKVRILPEETTSELEARLARIGAPHVLHVVNRLAENEDPSQWAIPQDPALACGAPKLRKAFAQIDWNRSAVEIRNQIRAFEPWPRTFTHWMKTPGKPPIRLIPQPIPQILEMSVPENTAPGTILTVGEVLAVATGKGVLGIHLLQPSGKRVLTIPEFRCGYGIQAGDHFQ